MYKQESVLENKTYKILWDFEIKTNPPFPAEDRTKLFTTTRNECPNRSQNQNKGKRKTR